MTTTKLEIAMPTLTITTEEKINIDIAQLADIYEEEMRYGLYERLSQNMDLGDDIASKIDDDDVLAKTILDLVKMEIFKRISEDFYNKYCND
jgi:hypothetical protein